MAMTPDEVLDELSAWLCEPSLDGAWRSPNVFIEYAADLIRQTGRSADPA